MHKDKSIFHQALGTRENQVGPGPYSQPEDRRQSHFLIFQLV